MMDRMVGSGLPMWLPNGTVLRRTLEAFLRDEQKRRGYKEVITPHIANLELYKTSGHYPYYQDSQYDPMQVDDEEYMLKPMNCPHHHRIYSNELRSYRDLPLRLAEFGTVYRYEQSGELNGLSRVRGFTQDDAHIYCTHDQLKDEIKHTIELTQFVFNTLGCRSTSASPIVMTMMRSMAAIRILGARTAEIREVPTKWASITKLPWVKPVSTDPKSILSFAMPLGANGSLEPYRLTM
jgi:threonyl-tRNA synthetase